MSGSRRLLAVSCLLVLAIFPAPARAADPQAGPPLTIHKAAGPITADGDLTDPGWQGVPSVTTWYETRVGDNVEPQVKNVAYLAYDDRYFYAGFEFEDPRPAAIRAPLGDHDNVPSTTDYAGVIVDSRNDGKTAQMFLANPRGVQYDAISSDVSGEDNAPDFFWDAAGRVTERGWTLEIRIPFSSLRYEGGSDPTWGLLLYRNYPRDRRYQFFSARLPRDVSCFICNSSKLTGLADLPRGSHLVVAPYATAGQTSAPEGDLGSRQDWEKVDDDYGVDVKWNPFANLTLDATVNPDFSQIESDQAQIVANERFALFFAEKRPFFLEGVDLLSTYMNAVYTRTITQPRTGLRATGRIGATAYTVLGTQDEGGGLVILPGPQGSNFALQDFESDVGIVRVRHDLGQSYLGLLANTREIHGGGSNRVAGPDFQWRPRPSDSFRGQILWSESRTPVRTDLTDEWDGRRLTDHAAQAEWLHSTPTHDWYLAGIDIGEDFRADNGFIPQVGYREAYFDGGITMRPKDAFLSRIRVFTTDYVDVDEDGDVLSQRVSVGSGMDGRWNSFFRVELNQEAFRTGERLLRRFRPRLYLESSPGRVFNLFTIEALVGEEIDFANGREANGVTLNGSVALRPSAHLELRGNVSRRWIDVDEPGASGRLLTAQVERLRTTWSFSSRSFLRLIVQYVETKRDPGLYTFEVPGKESRLSSSALFAYKLNWQTVLYAGYGDEREFAPATDQLEAAGRQWFTKMSYAWQR
jgi:hypothetical protein